LAAFPVYIQMNELYHSRQEEPHVAGEQAKGLRSISQNSGQKRPGADL
jgi:hypothetical protein